MSKVKYNNKIPDFPTSRIGLEDPKATVQFKRQYPASYQTAMNKLKFGAKKNER